MDPTNPLEREQTVGPATIAGFAAEESGWFDRNTSEIGAIIQGKNSSRQFQGF